MAMAVSSVARGRAFEQSCLGALSILGIEATRVGGAGDRGVDLTGRWLFPSTKRLYPSRLFNYQKNKIEGDEEAIEMVHVAVQCKDLGKSKVGPGVLRELEGTLVAFETQTKLPALGMICARSGYTHAAFDQCRRSRLPLALLDFDRTSHELTQFYINNAVRQLLPSLLIADQLAPNQTNNTKHLTRKLPMIFHQGQLLCKGTDVKLDW